MEIEIKKYIKSKYHFDCHLTKLTGFSGNTVYQIKNDDIPFCIIKIFSKDYDRQCEIESFQFLKNHQFKTIDVLDSININSHFLLLTKMAPGQLLADYFKKCDNQQILYQIGYQIGITLRRLHEIKKIKILESITESKLNKLIRHFKINKEITDHFLKNPGFFTYVHGDPSFHNFFISSQFEIIMIDSGNLIKIIHQEIPYGFPTGEYYRFIFQARLFAFHEKINQIVNIVIPAFEKGYGIKNDFFTPEAEIFFNTYWNKILEKRKKI